MKRNDVVQVNNRDSGYSPYGRIVKLLGDNKALVVHCLRDWEIVDFDQLIVDNEYQGYEWAGRFNRMPTLRKLKQMSRRYPPRENDPVYPYVAKRWRHAKGLH